MPQQESQRKNWTKQDIDQIAQLRLEGKNFEDIASIFLVTTNAARKALRRFTPTCQRIQPYSPKETSTVSLSHAIEWGVKNHVYVVFINRDTNMIQKNSIKGLSKTQIILMINRKRILYNLPIFTFFELNSNHL